MPAIRRATSSPSSPYLPSSAVRSSPSARATGALSDASWAALGHGHASSATTSPTSRQGSARERNTLYLPLPFTDREDVIHGQVLHDLDLPVWPRDLQSFGLCRGAEAEVHAHVVLGEVAGSARHLVDVRAPAGGQLQPRADRVPVRLPRANGAHEQRVVPIAALVQ